MRYPIVLLPALMFISCIGPLNNPSDSLADAFETESRAFVDRVSPFMAATGDTVVFLGGVTSEAVERAGLVTSFGWDLDNDGVVDTVLAGTDTLKMVYDSVGLASVRVILTDDLGETSEADTMVYLGWSDECPVYAQFPITMIPVLHLGNYITYRNKTESLAFGTLLYEFVKNLVGTINPGTLTLPVRSSFSDGIYTLSNDSISCRAVFHYGTTGEGYSELDTIKHNLFEPSSYVSGISAANSFPWYTIEKGPLWHLVSDTTIDLSNPGSPTVSFAIDLTEVYLSAYREVSDDYMMGFEMTPDGVITGGFVDSYLFHYHGKAKFLPTRVKTIPPLVLSDSLAFDLSGSEISSRTIPLHFKVTDNGNTYEDSIRLDLGIRQVMIDQVVRFGVSESNRRVTGTYSAVSRFAPFDKEVVRLFFTGNYSTAEKDTARFFCDESMTNQFGVLCFDTPDERSLTFESETYGYSFVIPDGFVQRP